MPIIPHANGEPFIKKSSFLSQFSKIMLIVWSANGDGTVTTLTTSKARKRYLPMHLCGQLRHPSGQIEQGAQYIRIIDLFNDESVSGESSRRTSP